MESDKMRKIMKNGKIIEDGIKKYVNVSEDGEDG
jgi:hypothetical protein